MITIFRYWCGETRNGRKVLYYGITVKDHWFRLFKTKKEAVTYSASNQVESDIKRLEGRKT